MSRLVGLLLFYCIYLIFIWECGGCGKLLLIPPVMCSEIVPIYLKMSVDKI